MEFAETLERLRRRAKITTYRLATDAGTDWTYVRRLEDGERWNPSRFIVLKLGQALLDNSESINLSDVNELLKAAGHDKLRRKKKKITISELYE